MHGMQCISANIGITGWCIILIIPYKIISSNAYCCIEFIGTWLQVVTEWKTESQLEWLNFLEKLYFIIVDLFYRYKSDNNMNIAYINHLQGCPWSLVRKILLDIITDYIYRTYTLYIIYDIITPCDKCAL